MHCLHRWQKHLDLELIKGPWTQEVEHPPSDPPTQPSATMGDIETISSLAEANDVLRNRGIDQVEGYQLVQFHLDERSSLLDAAEIKTRTRPGRVGFRLLNPELLDCKNKTKIEVEKAYKRLFNQCMLQCEQELVPLEAAIAELKRRLLLPDNEIADVGPDVMHRNRGVQQVPALSRL